LFFFHSSKTTTENRLSSVVESSVAFRRCEYQVNPGCL
jgi:hypothetical protein